jgi:hypothetical protein
MALNCLEDAFSIFSNVRLFFHSSLDLRRWGARFKENGARPYFEGHERSDVVESRLQFINYFLDRKQYYYTVTDDEVLPSWNTPSQKPPSILICK